MHISASKIQILVLPTLRHTAFCMTTTITAVPRLYVKVYWLPSDSPGYFSSRHIGFRPYGDAIPQSVSVPHDFSRGFATELALVTSGLARIANPDFISACRHLHDFFWFPSIRAHHLGHAVAHEALEAFPSFNSRNSTHTLHMGGDSICG